MDLTNHFLLAMPALADPNFDHALIYLCEHNDNGAMGLVLNRTMGLELGDILDQLDIADASEELIHRPVLYGGPVDQERGFVLHAPSGDWQASLDTGFGLAVTSSRDILEAMACGQGPEAALILLGYAGWAPGQLEYEMTENAWLSCPADLQVIFQSPPEQKLAAAAARMGVDLGAIAATPGHA